MLFGQEPLGAWRNIFMNVEPKRNDQVKDKRRSESDKRGINKIQPDTGRIDIHSLSQKLAHPKCGFLQHVAILVKETVYVT